MNCEAFRGRLKQIAASGEEPRGTSREHVNSCPSCKATFKTECLIFDLIDVALRAAVNCEIPGGLLERLRSTKAKTRIMDYRSIAGGERSKGESSFENKKNR